LANVKAGHRRLIGSKRIGGVAGHRQNRARHAQTSGPQKIATH
jgi:hypothetical protein